MIDTRAITNALLAMPCRGGSGPRPTPEGKIMLTIRTPGRSFVRTTIAAVVGFLIGVTIGPPSSAARPLVAAQVAAYAHSRLAPETARGPDVASSAQPSPAEPAVSDEVVRIVPRGRVAGKTVATALSSAVCSSCSGSAFTAAVIYGRRGRPVVADNVATAWATGCSDCTASAVSVQIVLQPRAGRVNVANRALAANAACERCSSTAIALQYVVVGAPQPPRDLANWLVELRNSIPQAVAPEAANPTLNMEARGEAPTAETDAPQQPAPIAATPPPPSIDAVTPPPGQAPTESAGTGSVDTSAVVESAVEESARVLQQRLDGAFGAGSTQLHVSVETG